MCHASVRRICDSSSSDSPRGRSAPGIITPFPLPSPLMDRPGWSSCADTISTHDGAVLPHKRGNVEA
eukprot:349907-Chlamydomonas_euryale.AAC.15